MSVSLDFLVKVLQLELIEVEHDLNGLKDLYANRHDSSEITHYVFLENTAVLQSELDAIHTLGSLLSEINISKSDTPHELLNSIGKYIEEEIKKRQFSRAVSQYIKLKIAKVSKYLDM